VNWTAKFGNKPRKRHINSMTEKPFRFTLLGKPKLLKSVYAMTRQIYGPEGQVIYEEDMDFDRATYGAYVISVSYTECVIFAAFGEEEDEMDILFAAPPPPKSRRQTYGYKRIDDQETIRHLSAAIRLHHPKGHSLSRKELSDLAKLWMQLIHLAVAESVQVDSCDIAGANLMLAGANLGG